MIASVSRWLLGVAAAALLASGASAQTLRGVTDKEVIIGMHTDLSGPAAFYGVAASQAARMRFDLINEQGGIHGRKVKLVVEDTQFQVPRGVAAINKLINRDKVFAIMGGTGSSIINAGWREQSAANVPNLFPITAVRAMFEPLDRLKFAMGTSFYDQIRAGIKYLVENGSSKALCVFYEDTDYGADVIEAARDQAKVMNLTIVDTVGVKPGDTDFTAPVTKMRQSGCGLVAMATILRTTIIPMGTAKRMGWTDVTFLGTSSPYEYLVAAAPGGATEGLYAGSGIVLPYPETMTPAVAEFAKLYKERTKQDLNAGVIYGWVGADLTAQGLDRAGRNLNVDTFVKGLESIQGYRDMFGGPVLNFSATDHRGGTATYLNRVENGRWVRVVDHSISY